MKKIQSFIDLFAWQEAHRMSLKIYEITKKFPKEEFFALVNQMKRSSISISSNIAEGFSRKTRKEKQQFYYMSLGSLTELQNQLIISKDIQYISLEKFKKIWLQTIQISKLINGLIKSAKNSSHNT